MQALTNGKKQFLDVKKQGQFIGILISTIYLRLNASVKRAFPVLRVF